jgi:cell fate regulator YaaT (PSP1 superfamily)
VCGRELCCTSWLKVLKPVNVKMAKAQGRPVSGDGNLGVCGRLRCCLRYELDGSGGCDKGGCAAH